MIEAPPSPRSPPKPARAPMDTPAPSSASQQRLATVLSASYIDADLRNALAVLDEQFVDNTAESRRQLRVNIQGDVIRSNAQIIRDFTLVAEVVPPSPFHFHSFLWHVLWCGIETWCPVAIDPNWICFRFHDGRRLIDALPYHYSVCRNRADS